MVSLDVTNPFPWVAKKETLEIINEYLSEKVKHLDDRMALTKILGHATKQIFFRYGGRTWKQDEGQGIDSSLSPLMAEFFYGHYKEQNILH